ncbi:Uncharacterised protein [Yersinia enterocolitica]|nr:Uncharacterised protein [Yersinia enterocolitica]
MVREVNDFVGWGLDGHGNATLFCSNCRAVFYKTYNHSKIIQARRVFSKKHKCETNRKSTED